MMEESNDIILFFFLEIWNIRSMIIAFLRCHPHPMIIITNMVINLIYKYNKKIFKNFLFFFFFWSFGI